MCLIFYTEEYMLRIMLIYDDIFLIYILLPNISIIIIDKITNAFISSLKCIDGN